MDATGAHPVEGNKPETEQQIPNVLPYARELKFRKEENQTKRNAYVSILLQIYFSQTFFNVVKPVVRNVILLSFWCSVIILKFTQYGWNGYLPLGYCLQPLPGLAYLLISLFSWVLSPWQQCALNICCRRPVVVAWWLKSLLECARKPYRPWF